MKIIVQNRKIISQGKFPVSQNINAYKLQIEFRDSEGIGWDSLEKRIIFKNGKDSISVPLTEKIISVPWEVLQNTGNLYITIIGMQLEPYKRIVTEKMKDGIPVTPSGIVDGNDPGEPTKDTIAFIMEKVDEITRLQTDITNLETLLKSIQEKINSGTVDTVTVNEINNMIVEYFENKLVSEVEYETDE